MNPGAVARIHAARAVANRDSRRSTRLARCAACNRVTVHTEYVSGSCQVSRCRGCSAWRRLRYETWTPEQHAACHARCFALPDTA